MIGDFARGFRYGLAGLSWLARPGIRRFVVLPLAVNVAIFSAGIAWLLSWLGGAQATLSGWLPDWLAWLSWLLWPLALAALLVLVWTGFTLLANLIASPFNGLLAARVAARRVAGWRTLEGAGWRELALAPVAELRKLAYFGLLALVPLIASFLPVVNLAAPFVWALYGAWVLALEYCEYPLSNAGTAFGGVRRTLAARRGLALGFGAAVALLTVVPGLNLVAMPAAVIGATLLWAGELSGGAQGPAAAGGARAGRGAQRLGF